MIVRPYRASDRPAIEKICIESGLKGNLETYFSDPNLFAKLWLAPFLDAEPDSTWVAEENDVVIGYLVSAIRPNFKKRALRALLPHLGRLILKWTLGKYRSHPESGRFVRWYLFQAWREIPRQKGHSSNFHFNVSKDYRGNSRAGDALMTRYFEELRSRNIETFHIHVFGSAGKRDIKFYQGIGFKIADVKRCSLFHKPTVVASLVRPIPAPGKLFERDKKHRVPKISVVLEGTTDDEQLAAAIDELKAQALPAREVVVVTEVGREIPPIDMNELIVTKAKSYRQSDLFNAGLKQARGDIVVIVSADAAIDFDLLARIASDFDNGISWGPLKTRPRQLGRKVPRDRSPILYYASRELWQQEQFAPSDPLNLEGIMNAHKNMASSVAQNRSGESTKATLSEI